MSEFESEPVRGLPEELPAGERLLWQGAPRWQALAVRAFHARKVAVYFGVLATWRLASGLADGDPVGQTLITTASLLPFALAAVGLLVLLAVLAGRTTVYSITTRRVVMRFGIALPMVVNVPFRIIESASLRLHSDGTGDIPLVLTGDDRLAYLHLWPHARPWKVRRPQPMLRGVQQGEAVADILARALAAAAGAQPAHVTMASSDPIAHPMGKPSGISAAA